jgi:hypothetical protein
LFAPLSNAKIPSLRAFSAKSTNVFIVPMGSPFSPPIACARTDGILMVLANGKEANPPANVPNITI